MGKGQTLQQIVLGKLDIHIERKLHPYLIPYIKINSKWIIVRAKTIKYLEENIGGKLHNV